jgi:hypothetical protein
MVQRLVDFTACIIEFGNWIRVKKPSDEAIQARLTEGHDLPSRDLWLLHPDNYMSTWADHCPGANVFDVEPVVQLAHPTDPQNNWSSEHVWLFKLRFCKRPRAWQVGVYDPMVACQLLLGPNGQDFQSMESFLDFLLNGGARLCTPARTPNAGLTTKALEERRKAANETRRQRQSVVLPTRDEDYKFRPQDFAASMSVIPHLFEDHAFMRACALHGGWITRIALTEIDDSVVLEGPTKAALRGPNGKVFMTRDGHVLHDDAAEYQQLLQLLGVFTVPTKNETQQNWPKKSFFPSLKALSKLWLLPNWMESDERQFASVMDRYQKGQEFKEPLKHSSKPEAWKLFPDRCRLDFTIGARAVCRSFLDAVLGPPPTPS